YRVGLWQRFCVLYLPAIFPYLVTGWVTAAGGAWNASIVSEYVTFHGKPEWVTWGLGAQITLASNPPAPEKENASGNGADGKEPTAGDPVNEPAPPNNPPSAGEGKEEEVQPDIPNLVASVVVMALMVVAFNRFVWRRLYNLAEQRYSLNK